MTAIQMGITIAVCTAATMLTRFLPFVVFSSKDQQPPEVVRYLGRVLPAAIFGMLIVYCLKSVTAPGGHGGADRAGLPAPAAGSPGGKGPDGGHRAGIPRRDSAGRIRGESGRRRAPYGLWHRFQPAVGQPDRLKNRNIRFSAQKRKRPRAQKLSA